jgi:Zn-dependent peptidase ImmA (M78 family)/transcriptional regulator with XRE-family HTH domain
MPGHSGFEFAPRSPQKFQSLDETADPILGAGDFPVTPKVENLKDIREKLLGYTREAAARMSHISVERLTRIEDKGDAPTVFEADALSRIYGIDADRLADDPIQLAKGDGVVTLASLDEFRALDDVTRMRSVAAANAARDLASLRHLETNEDGRDRFRRETPGLDAPKKLLPYQQGAKCAAELRNKLKLGNAPISSMRDFVAERFPSISVLYAELGGAGPAGLTFLDHLRGPTIVLNLEGKNKNPCVRRFSLAHELCHLFLDWNRLEPVATISGYLNENQLEVEQRANAFAVRLICPQKVIQGLVAKDATLSDPETARVLASYGLPYGAIRLYLRNEGQVELPENPGPAFTILGTEARWVAHEEPTGIEGFPLDEVKPERRTEVARVAARLYSVGRIRRDQFADALGITPAADLESVLDFFTLNVPSEDVSVTVA